MAAERDAKAASVPPDGAACTTPERPATSRTGPPVTEDTSDGRRCRKQGGTVE